MRKVFNILCCTLVTVLFLTATMGFSVHYCVREKTPHVLLLYAGSPCTFVHNHVAGEDQKEAAEEVPEHDDWCCSTQVFSIHDPSLKGTGARVCSAVETVTPPHLFPAVPAQITTTIPEQSFVITYVPGKVPDRSVYPGNHLVPLRL